MVQLVGRVGEDPAGEATLLALARDGIGHVATLRDPARPTPALAAAVTAGPEPGRPRRGGRRSARTPVGRESGSSTTDVARAVRLG